MLFCEYFRTNSFSAFQTKYLEMVLVVSRRGNWIPRLGVEVLLLYALESHQVRLLDLWGQGDSLGACEYIFACYAAVSF